MDALTPDLAEKVLTAEVRNLIKKVSDGGTLSAAARTMFHKAAMLPGLANDARVTSLFKRWAAGGRLTSDELVELRAWSAAPVVDPPAIEPPPAPTPAPALAEAPAFSLSAEGPRLVGSRVKYPEPLSAYAARYDVDERSIKRYIARGREVTPPDLPPFHQPGEMPAWWDRRMPAVRCPAGFLLAAEKVRLATPAAAPAPVPSPPPPPAEHVAPVDAAAKIVLPGRDFSDIETLDLAQNVEQLRRSLAISMRLLEEARQGADENLITARQRNYRDTFTELRKAENDLLAWQQERGLLAPRDEVRAENNRIASTVFNAVLRLLKKVRPQIHGKPEFEQDRIWAREFVSCFSVLKGAKFTSFEVPEEIVL